MVLSFSTKELSLIPGGSKQNDLLKQNRKPTYMNPQNHEQILESDRHIDLPLQDLTSQLKIYMGMHKKVNYRTCQ